MRSSRMWWGVVLICVPVALAQTPRDQVLRHVPEKAAVVAVFPSAAKLIDGVRSFGKAIGVDEMAALSTADVLDELDIIGGETIDAAGPFVLALLPGGPGEAVLIGTVTDPAKWKTETGVKEAEGGFLTADTVDAKFALDGNVVMMCEDEDVLKQAVAGGLKLGERMGAALTGELDRNDVVVWVDLAGLEKELRDGLKELGSAFEEGMAAAGPQGAGMAGFMKWGVESLQSLAADGQSMALLVRVGEPGIHIRKQVQMKPDSRSAAYLKKIRKTDRDPLRGLIDDKPALCFAAEWELPADEKSLMHVCTAAMIDAAKPADEVQAKAAAALAMFDKLTGMSGSVALAENGKLVTSGVYFTTDAAGVLERLAAFQEVNQQVATGLTPGLKVDVTQSHEEIGGADALIIESRFSGDDPSLTAPMEAMYGGNMTVAAAAKGPDVLMGMGAAAAAKAQLAKLLATDARPVAANAQVKAALGTIAAGPQMVWLVDLPRLAQMGITVASGMGLPLPPIKFPEAATPLMAMGMYVQETGIVAELHIPTGAIKPVVDTVKATMSPPPEDQQ